MSIQVEIDSDAGIDPNTIDALTPEEFTSFVAPELNAFEKAFTALGQNPFIGIERALLRTYLAWKLGKIK